jgi:putative nucleotidyltransferase with HDIG domain
MITREQALKLLHDNMQNNNLRRHCYAVEATMKALAEHLNEDSEKWAIVGLLHDSDYEKTKETPKEHTLITHKWLTDMGETDEEILLAILSHNFAHTGQNAPKNKLEWSLYCCDELTGLIVACALVKPDKKLSSVTVDTVLNKWNAKSFAAGVDRKQIEMCEEKLGIKLNDFIGITLKAMQTIAPEIGL